MAVGGDFRYGTAILLTLLTAALTAGGIVFKLASAEAPAQTSYEPRTQAQVAARDGSDAATYAGQEAGDFPLRDSKTIVLRPAVPRSAPPAGAGEAGEDEGSEEGEGAEQALRRVVDQEVFRWIGKDLRAARRKDLNKLRPYRVDLFQDDESKTVTRAQVDYERDGAWDEEWTIQPGLTQRRVLAGEGREAASFSWDGKGWREE